MNLEYHHINTPLKILGYCFIKDFDGAYIVGNPDSDQIGCLDATWDGELYWMPSSIAQPFLNFVPAWFQQNIGKMQLGGDNIVSNCILYQKTKDGMLFVDTQRDNSSIVYTMIEDFISANPQLNFNKHVQIISDCHLADNLYFSRQAVENEDAILTLLYEQGVLAESCFLDHIEDCFSELESFIHSKKVVLTGVFSISHQEIIEQFNSVDFPYNKSLSPHCWLWIGKKPGNVKVQKAITLGVETSTILEVMKWYLLQTGQYYISPSHDN